MSQRAAPSTSFPASSTTENARLPLTAPIVIGIAGTFLFVATQVCVVAVAAIWAIGGYMHFGLTGFSLLGTVIALPALYMCWKLLVMTITAERDPANN